MAACDNLQVQMAQVADVRMHQFLVLIVVPSQQIALLLLASSTP